MKRALIWTGNIAGCFNNDEWDSFRGEGRITINLGFGISELGYDVNIVFNGWNLNEPKKTWNNIELSKTYLYDYYDLVITFGKIDDSATFKFGTALCIVYEDDNITGVKKYIENIKSDDIKNNVMYTVLLNDELLINKVKEITKSENVCYVPVLYPITSINKGFLPCSYSSNLPELKVFLYYAAWSQNTTISGDRFLHKEQLIIDYLVSNKYNVKLTILVQNKEMIDKCSITNKDTKFVCSEKCSYRDIINLIQNSDICITNGAPAFPGNALIDMISLGKPMIYIGDGRIGIEWKGDNKNLLYKQKEICDNYIIYMQERDNKSLEKLDRIMKDPLEVCKKYANAYKDNNFNEWKPIIEKVLIQKNKLTKSKKKTVLINVVNPTRSPIMTDQYDSFRSEGRIPINMGFGLALLGFEVNIVFNEWKIVRKKEVWKNVYLSNLPLHKHYDYVLGWEISQLDNITFDKMIFMDWYPCYIHKISDYIKTTNKDIVYTINNKPAIDYSKRQNEIYPLELNYLPGLYPIPSVNVGFLQYNFNPTSELKFYIYYNVNRGYGMFLKKQQLIIDFFRSKGYKIKIYMHTTSKETTNPFSNVSNEDVKYLYDTKARYIDVINIIKSSDICVTSGTSMTSSSLQEVISLGKPMIYISDTPIDIKKHMFVNSLYYYPDYLLYTSESDEESTIKLEKFLINPEESYNKFKEAFKDLDFNTWKEIAKKFFTTNKGDENMDENKNENTINKFGDGISWENHVHEILDNNQNIFYSSENQEKINYLKKYKSSGRALDCGCHIGRWIEVFRGNGYDYVGVDQSYEALETFKKYKPDAKIVHSLLWNMSFDNDFDVVHTNAVLQHNTLLEQEKILPKMNRALKHNGILIIAESTEPKQTLTQRTYQGWISFIEKYGFKFMESWHKNPLGFEDNYLFIKVNNVKTQSTNKTSKIVTKESLKQLINNRRVKDITTKSNPEIIIPKPPKINVTTNKFDNNVINNNTLYMNEYWNDKIIALLETILLWRNLKVSEQCYFEYEFNLPSDKINYTKSVFEEAGFKFIDVDNTNRTKITFEKLSITKIKNWKQLRHIHELLNK